MPTLALGMLSCGFATNRFLDTAPRAYKIHPRTHAHGKRGHATRRRLPFFNGLTYRFPSVSIGRSSVRNGEAGSPAALNRLGSAS